MEIVLIIVLVVSLWLGAIMMAAAEIRLKTYVLINTAILASVFVLYFISGVLSTAERTVRTDILEYKQIVYSAPQVINETVTNFPFWSSRQASEYTVITEK